MITRNMSKTRRPRTEFVEAFKIYAKTNEEKLKAGEMINKERLSTVIQDMKEVVKSLEYTLKNLPDNQAQVLEDSKIQGIKDMVEKLDPEMRKNLINLLKASA